MTRRRGRGRRRGGITPELKALAARAGIAPRADSLGPADDAGRRHLQPPRPRAGCGRARRGPRRPARDVGPRARSLPSDSPRPLRRRAEGKQVRVKGQRYPITYAGYGSNKRNWSKAGVEARIHDLRHTTGMRTMRKTGNLKMVQKILGHTDIAITARFYTDATVDDCARQWRRPARARSHTILPS
ncbi:tyrosine-type recombinase/integrase [Bradyrhizobium sp. DASA03120]|uniref:tyrosine-type recombinase/integrase n=1 Tax=Bradyrhizobium sp. SMVTL-02 TaxID=3395917 RepID=UPI003F704219